MVDWATISREDVFTAPKEVTTTTPERLAMKYRLSLDGAKKQIQEISDLGKEIGIDFRYATTQYSNTRDAHRLMKLAEAKYDRETVARLNKALFAAYFTEYTWPLRPFRSG